MSIYVILLSSENIDIRYMFRYIRFIQSRRISDKISEYFEKHHILPKSLYPEHEHDTDNLICLTAKEHYIAHLLLYRAFPNSNSMLYAFWGMCNGWINSDLQQRIIPNYSSSTYDRLKKQVSIEMSRRLSENNPYNTQEIKNKIIEKYGGLGSASSIIRAKQKQTLREKYGVDNSFQIPEVIQKTRKATLDRNKDPEYRKLQQKKIKESLKSIDRSRENNSFFGKKHSDETKKRISDKKRGCKTPRYCCMNCRKEIGINNLTQHLRACRGEKITEITCSHCEFKGKPGSNMNRWHLDNCKHRK